MGGSGFLILGASKRAANCLRIFSISASKRGILFGVGSESLAVEPWPKIVEDEEPLPLNSVFYIFENNKSNERTFPIDKPIVRQILVVQWVRFCRWMECLPSLQTDMPTDLFDRVFGQLKRKMQIINYNIFHQILIANLECPPKRPVLHMLDVEAIYSSRRIEDILMCNSLCWDHRVKNYR